MKIKIVCVGSVKEEFFKQAINEYVKRLSRFVTVEVVEIKESKLPANFSEADVEKALEKENEQLFKAVEGYVFVCDLNGKELTSEDFAKGIKKLENLTSTISFVIGSSYGLSHRIKQRANFLLKFGNFTYPHQLFRVILMEQIYRAYTIINNVTYHK